MASDCAVPSSSSSFSAEEPESPPGCQTLEWVVSRYAPPSFLHSESSGLSSSQRLRQRHGRGGEIDQWYQCCQMDPSVKAFFINLKTADCIIKKELIACGKNIQRVSVFKYEIKEFEVNFRAE
ncbi:hypothetical protein E5288_WYG012029 [Bos mutus]|uniref:Uncharacterized protein n=1 Tax=Bos mutus TaxID=72004 RepID=A0A6B0S5R7_9CETA|nr:hypothetical protein [Bos mutus]